MRRPREAAVALGVCWLSACSSPQLGPPGKPLPTPAVRSATPSPTLPVHIETNGVGDQYPTIVERLNEPGGRSRTAYQLRARSWESDIVGAQSVASFTQPHISFFDRRGKRLIADSPQAKVTQHEQSVLMSGGVHATTDTGSRLTCDTLRYDGRSEQIHGVGHIELTSPTGLMLTGNYLQGDVRLDHVRISARPL